MSVYGQSKHFTHGSSIYTWDSTCTPSCDMIYTWCYVMSNHLWFMSNACDPCIQCMRILVVIIWNEIAKLIGSKTINCVFDLDTISWLSCVLTQKVHIII